MNDAHWMGLALAQAQAAAEAGEVPVGAVVVRGEACIATAHNATRALNDPTAHAEVLALRAAAQAVGNHRLIDCTLYVTLEPCAMCAQASLHARVARVVYGAPEPKFGADGSQVQVLRHHGLNHHTEVLSGVLPDDAQRLMVDFFLDKRKAIHRQRVPLREDAARDERGLPLAWQSALTGWAHLYFLTTDGWRLHAMKRTSKGSPVVQLADREAWSVPLALNAAPDVTHVLDPLGIGLSDKPKRPHAHTMALHVAALTDWLADLPPGPIRWRASTAYLPWLDALAQRVPHREQTVECVEETTHASRDMLRWPYPTRGAQSVMRCPTWPPRNESPT